jgi:thiamine biosynthesis lipoprotein ApbE
MIQTPRLLFCCVALLFCAGCASSKLAQYTDYSVGVGQAYPAEQATAQKRVDRYLAHLKLPEKERLASVEYIAVEATTVPISEIPGLASRIANGRLRGETSITSSDPHQALSGDAKFIMIFDPKTGQPLNQEGYVAVETPRKGKIGIFGGYTALYIGNGR